MDNSAKTEALMLAATLAVNESVRRDCPVCNHKTFSVTRLEHSVAFNCYRATCPASGVAITSAALVSPAPRTAKLRPYRGKILPLDDSDVAYFRDRFSITNTGVIRKTDDGRYIFCIQDYRGYVRGYLVREPVWAGEPQAPLKGRGGAKALTYMHTEGPVQSWHTNDSGTLILVEDTLSALRVQGEGLSALCLLGTHLNNDKVREISQWQPKEVVIALDADATDEAFRLAKRWGLAFPRTRVAILERDLKDERKGDIRHILGVSDCLVRT